jgi:hypothetical protein
MGVEQMAIEYRFEKEGLPKSYNMIRRVEKGHALGACPFVNHS